MTASIRSLTDLVGAAAALGAADLPGLSPQEAKLLAAPSKKPSPDAVRELRELVGAGRDPLGDAFCGIYSAEQRRPLGATYTPPAIVSAMVAWAADQSPKP